MIHVDASIFSKKPAKSHTPRDDVKEKCRIKPPGSVTETGDSCRDSEKIVENEAYGLKPVVQSTVEKEDTYEFIY